MHEITKQLKAWSDGEPKALEKLIPLVDKELRKIAKKYLRKERSENLLQTTALVHEALIRLIRDNINYENRKHFYVLVAKRMRQVLIDYARKAKKAEYVDVDVEILPAWRSNELIMLDAALKELARDHERKVTIVECRFFIGLTLKETAELLNISQKTVERDWRFARVWLKRAMRGES